MPRRRSAAAKADEVEKPSEPQKEKKLDSNEECSTQDKKHAELLALPPHGSEVFLGGIPHDASKEDVRGFCECIGEVTEALYIKNLTAKTGHENSRFGFVHFADRSNAMKAVKNTEKYELDGQVLECSLAKPQTDQKSSGGSILQKPALLPRYQLRGGYGMVGGACELVGTASDAPSLAQAMFSTAHYNEFKEMEELMAEKHKELLAAKGEESVFDSSDQSDSEEEEEGYVYIPSDEEILLWELHQADEKRERQKHRQSTVPLKEDFKSLEFGGRAIRVGSPLNVNRMYDSGMRSIQVVTDPFFWTAVPTPPPPPPPPYRPRLSFSTPSPTYPSTGHFCFPYYIPPSPPYRPHLSLSTPSPTYPSTGHFRPPTYYIPPGYTIMQGGGVGASNAENAVKKEGKKKRVHCADVDPTYQKKPKGGSGGSEGEKGSDLSLPFE